MAARHGTRRGYNDGCRCDDCKDAQRRYQQRYRERQRSLAPVPNGTPDVGDNATTSMRASSPGPVEEAVEAEISKLADARPGLAQAALALARVLDNDKAVSSQPAAAKVLASLLDKLRTASAQGRRGRLAMVRTFTERSGA
jgi:hypothetical protein